MFQQDVSSENFNQNFRKFIRTTRQKIKFITLVANLDREFLLTTESIKIGCKNPDLILKILLNYTSTDDITIKDFMNENKI